jgi:hypothetical protein
VTRESVATIGASPFSASLVSYLQRYSIAGSLKLWNIKSRMNSVVFVVVEE